MDKGALENAWIPEQAPPHNKIVRRKFLRFIGYGVAALLSGEVLTGCGGGGGGAPIQPTRVSGSVNTKEVGGSPLTLQSAVASDTPLSSQGEFSLVSSTLTVSLLFVKDAASKLRALAVLNPQKTVGVTLDATSTALGLVLITPGILTLDPAKLDQRIQQISGQGSFAPFVSYLAQKLPTQSINDLQTDTALESLKATCISDWFTANGRAAKSHRGLLGDPAFTAVLTTAPTAVPFWYVDLTNSAWRFLSIVREDLAAPLNGSADPKTPEGQGQPLRQAQLSFHEGLLVGLAGLFDGATIVDYGSIFTGTAEQPAKGSDPPAPKSFTDSVTDIPRIASVKYWVYGPGNPLLNDSLNPPSLTVENAFNKANAIGVSMLYYLLWPALDLIIGSVSEHQQQIKLALDTWWQSQNVAVNAAQLVHAIEHGNSDEKWAAIIGIGNALVADGLNFVIALAKAGVISITDPKELAKKATDLSGLSFILSAANIAHALVDWARRPTIASVEVLVSSAQVTIK